MGCWTRRCRGGLPRKPPGRGENDPPGGRWRSTQGGPNMTVCASASVCGDRVRRPRRSGDGTLGSVRATRRRSSRRTARSPMRRLWLRRRSRRAPPSSPRLPRESPSLFRQVPPASSGRQPRPSRTSSHRQPQPQQALRRRPRRESSARRRLLPRIETIIALLRAGVEALRTSRRPGGPGQLPPALSSLRDERRSARAPERAQRSAIAAPRPLTTAPALGLTVCHRSRAPQGLNGGAEGGGSGTPAPLL